MCLKLYKGCVRLTMQWVRTMAATLKQQVQHEVRGTIECLVPKTTVQPPRLAILISDAEYPIYKEGTLVIPRSFTNAVSTLKTYRFGELAGLVLLYHGNPAVQPLFEKANPQYCFWSRLAMTYTGLAAVLQQQDKTVANKHAVCCRDAAKEENRKPMDLDDARTARNFASNVGIEYAAQLYQRCETGELSRVLTAHSSIHDIHKLVVPNEDFSLFATLRGWK